tara:strand:- start:99 stop:542 length:444 start_codon:yes stop_codon:yes gene_type:complete
MLWFEPKKFKLVINDKEIEKEVRNNSYSYITNLLTEKGPTFIAELIQQNKLSPNFFRATWQLLQLGSNNTLFRGIDKRNYGDFLRYGNDKTPENISEHEAEKLRKYGLNPSEVLSYPCLSISIILSFNSLASSNNSKEFKSLRVLLA